MRIHPYKTRIFAPLESLAAFILESVPRASVQNGMVLAVTSKIVSLAEGRTVLKSEYASKADLVKLEADHFLGEIGHGVSLTIKHGLFIASAGIDESNANGDYYILFPENPYASAKKLWTELRAAWGIENLGILLTDSKTSPLRRGVTGVGLSYWGFKPVRKLVGKLDLFGKPFRMTYVNHVDALSAAAVYAMGEGEVPMPLAAVYGADLEFTGEDHRQELEIPLEEDLYYPFFKPHMDLP